MAALHDGPGGDREILAAFLFSATIPAGLLGLVGVVDRAAMRANRAFGPAQIFQPFAGRFVDWKWGAIKAFDMAYFLQI